MTECVQRHDVCDEDYSAAYLAKVDKEIAEQNRREWMRVAWITGPMFALTLALAILAVLT